MIPINAPELSMQTSLTEGLRPETKIDGIHPALRSLHRKYRRGEITRTLSLDIHKAGKKQPRQEENIQSYELLSEHKLNGIGLIIQLIITFAFMQNLAFDFYDIITDLVT